MTADKYVGLDAHKATCVIVVLDASGTLVQQTIVPTGAASLTASTARARSSSSLATTPRSSTTRRR